MDHTLYLQMQTEKIQLAASLDQERADHAATKAQLDTATAEIVTLQSSVTTLRAQVNSTTTTPTPTV